MAWRLKEIAYIKSNAKTAKSFAQAALLRAGVPLVYAHWEGFVKDASESYLSFVANQRLPQRELASCFVVFGAKNHVRNLVDSRRSSINAAAVDFIRNNENAPANLTVANAINTESNLGSKAFENIAVSIGVPVREYVAYSNLIDKELLKRRNRIAHGEHLDLDWSAFDNLVDQVLVLLKMFKNDIENLASTQAYKLPVQ